VTSSLSSRKIAAAALLLHVVVVDVVQVLLRDPDQLNCYLAGVVVICHGSIIITIIVVGKNTRLQFHIALLNEEEEYSRISLIYGIAEKVVACWRKSPGSDLSNQLGKSGIVYNGLGLMNGF
jgi:hypothetical protein